MSQLSARDHHAGDTAMTEIALALAMAFFSILVLALVSMGAGRSDADGTPKNAAEIIAAGLAPAPDVETATVELPIDHDILIVYHDGRFFDQFLSPLSAQALSALSAETSGNGRVVLAVPPSLSIEKAMSVRGQVPSQDAIVTTLDDAWLARLAE